MGEPVIIDNMVRFWDTISSVVHLYLSVLNASSGLSMAARIERPIERRPLLYFATEEEGQRSCGDTSAEYSRVIVSTCHTAIGWNSYAISKAARLLRSRISLTSTSIGL